jgi:2-alkenal reductase
MILEVTPGSPAERAGLIGSESLAAINGTESRVGGDVVIAIDGQTINSTDDLITHLARYTSVNQTITTLILRDRQQQTIEVTLGARPTS